MTHAKRVHGWCGLGSSWVIIQSLQTHESYFPIDFMRGTMIQPAPGTNRHSSLPPSLYWDLRKSCDIWVHSEFENTWKHAFWWPHSIKTHQVALQYLNRATATLVRNCICRPRRLVKGIRFRSSASIGDVSCVLEWYQLNRWDVLFSSLCC
jgi:hypothetical protein